MTRPRPVTAEDVIVRNMLWNAEMAVSRATNFAHAALPKCSNVRLFVINCIITNNIGSYLTFHECILCLFIIRIIGILSFDHQIILFNDTLNTLFYGYMVKDHSDSERGDQIPPLHEIPFLNSSKRCFVCSIPHQNSTYHGLCYTSCGALARNRNRSIITISGCSTTWQSHYSVWSYATVSSDLQGIEHRFHE